jgi:hypothetical protein
MWDPLLISNLIRHKDGGGEKYNSPPVFKEGLGVVFPLLSKSDDNSVKSANGGFNHYSR